MKPNTCEITGEELNAAVARGATQYVILGGGPDNCADDRNTNLRVFQIGHTAEQTQGLRPALAAEGFQPGEVSFFSWLGVSPYRSAQATLEALAFIGSLPAGSSVVFDYAVHRTLVDPGFVKEDETAMDALASRIAAEGESVQLSINSRALHKFLRFAGFHEVEDVPSGIAHLVSARV